MRKKHEMLNAYTIQYVHQKEYDDIFKEYYEIVQDVCELKFRRRIGVPKDSLNAECGWLKKSPIIVYPEWAARVVLKRDDEYVRNAFRFTLGHELAHKDRRYRTLPIPCKFFEFIAQVNEVYADFGAAIKVADGSRAALLSSIEYKRDNKSKTLSNIKQDNFHPSWERRKYYVENFDFGKRLIEEIAKDNHCHGKLVERFMIRFYNGFDITLTPKIKT